MVAKKTRHHKTKNKTAKSVAHHPNDGTERNQQSPQLPQSPPSLTIDPEEIMTAFKDDMKSTMNTIVQVLKNDEEIHKIELPVLLSSVEHIVSHLDHSELYDYLKGIDRGTKDIYEFVDYLESIKNPVFGNKKVVITSRDVEEMGSNYDDDTENDEYYEHEEVNEDDNDSEEEYSFDLELSNNFFDPYKFHIAVFKLLRITIPNNHHCSKEDERIENLFSSFATLCDSYTQPSSTGEHNEMILSADLISDLILALNFNEYIEYNHKGKIINLPEFDMAYDIARIIEKIMILLNADDEDVLIGINNDEEHWESELPKWLPHNSVSNIFNIASDFHHMMLLYTIVTAGLLVIHKLYKKLGNICLNPFLSLFLQLWKNQTRIIYLGIEIDRRDEENGYTGYPEVIRYMIKGSSAIRSMLSLILNDDFDRRLHDLKHESLINFMRPWGRKFTNGSITRDIRIFVAALLALGSELDSVTELLFNFDPEDRYDEDIKYMFEMELDDMDNLESKDIDTNDEDGDKNVIDEQKGNNKDNVKRYIGKNGILEIERHDEEIEDADNMSMTEYNAPSIYDLHPDCHCVFEDFESDYDEEEIEEEDTQVTDLDENTNIERVKQLKQLDNDKFINDLESLSDNLNNIELKDLDIETIQKLHLDAIKSINIAPSAVRTKMNKQSEIDSKGRDWRDIPRGDNQILTSDFIKLLHDSISDSSIFLTPMENLLSALESMTVKTLDSKTCEKIIRSIAWVVQYEHEGKLMSDEEAKMYNDANVNADVIYNFLKADDNFVKMMDRNPSSAFFIIDELLMAEGYRRVLIWFLTHLPLNQWLINYFHDLLISQRGNPDDENSNGPKHTRFSFSRMGPLVLSEVEKSMLLHEFLSNAVIYLSSGSSYELEDIMWNQLKEDNKDDKNGKKPEENTNISSFITNRSNAQKLIKVICLMLKSLEKHNVLDPKDSEYRVEIQTLLVQWVGVGFVPEARELFFKYSNQTEESKMNDTSVTTSDNTKEVVKATNKAAKNEMSTVNGNKDKHKTEKEEYQELLMKLYKSNFHKLTSQLGFSSFDLFILTLNMAHHYKSEKDTCFEFLKGLNTIYHVYDTDDELMKAFDDFYSALNNAIVSGDDEKVIEIMHASKFLSNETIIQARRAMKDIAEGEIVDGNREINVATDQTLQLLKEFPLEECRELEKHKRLLKEKEASTDNNTSGIVGNSTPTDTTSSNGGSNSTSGKKKKKKHRKHK